MKFIRNVADISRETRSVMFDATTPHRLVLAARHPFPAPSPLLFADDPLLLPWLADWHRKPWYFCEPQDVSCYFFADLTVSGRGHLLIGGDLLASPDLMPLYWRGIIEKGLQGIDVAYEQTLPSRVIEEPCVPLVSYGIDVYGHVLVETLPKLHLIRSVLRNWLPAHKYLLAESTSKTTLKILEQAYGLTAADIVFFDPAHEKMTLRQAIVPSYCLFDEFFHPVTNLVFDEIVAAMGGDSGLRIPRVFITRALLARAGRRPCTNELELAHIAATEFDFAPIAPETLSWREQVRLFAGTGCIVGEFGSGMHNTALAARGTRVGVISFGNLLQTSICSLRQQPIGYLIVPQENDGTFSVEPDRFRRFMEAIVP
jgi:hypothetical protein